MPSKENFDTWCRNHNQIISLKLSGWLLFWLLLLWPLDWLLLLWPLDWLLLAGLPGAVEAFAVLRAGSVLVLLLFQGLSRWTAIPSRFPLLLPVVCMGLLSGWIPYWLGTLGDLQTPWFHLLYWMMVGPIFLRTSLEIRAGIHLSYMVLSWGAWLVARPDSLENPFFLVILCFSLLVLGIGIAFGNILTKQASVQWHQEREFEKNADILEKKIESQTQHLRVLAAHLAATQEAERHRLSQELHDELGQELTGLRYGIAAMKRKGKLKPEEIEKDIEFLEAQASRTADTVRNILLDLRPRVLEDLGLQAAIEWLVERVRSRGEIEIKFETNGTEAVLSQTLALTLYRFVQEALTNIQKHAEADKVKVELQWQAGDIRIKVSDNGKGFDTRKPVKGLGLLGIRERLLQLGGKVVLTSEIGKGTTIEGFIPANARMQTEKANELKKVENMPSNTLYNMLDF
jgi:signal transduction histidine kinase